MGDINKMIQWMKDHEGPARVVYNNDRPWGGGSPAHYDCSAAVIESLRAGGFLAPGPNAGWTGSLHSETLPKIAHQISRSECKRGDIFISNWNEFDGHTGFFLENNKIIHCNAYDMTISISVANGRMGNAPYEYYRLNDASNSGNTYSGGALTNAGFNLSETNIQLIINAAKSFNIKPSFMIAQMFIESHWGDPNTSTVGNVDNNWSGISEPFSVPADLGINISRGSARPANEGGYYVHFATLNDFFKAYAFVLSKRNGLYNVEGANSIEEYCKGLFRIGGANSDYAATGYQNYFNMLIPTYNSINKQNPGKLAQIDASTEEITNNGGVTIMQCLYERPINPNTGALDINGSATTMMFCNGVNTRRVYHNDEVNIVKELYRKNNGKEIPVYYKKDWPKTSPWYIRLEAMFPVVK